MKRFVTVFFLLGMVSCSQPDKQSSIHLPAQPDSILSISRQDVPTAVEAYYRVTGDSMLLPSFTIELKLSPTAEAKLKSDNETVVVSADFLGVPKDTTLKFYQQWGYVVVGNQQMELEADRSVTFSSVKISKAAYDSLASKDVTVSINIFSGRHSTENNLLSCESLEEPISKIRKQNNVLSGKLIGE